jgi:hypothetical protein
MNWFIKKPLWLICLVLLGGLGAVLFLASCATIVHGTKQKITVNSEPAGAKVVVRGVEMATTPAIIELERNNPNVVLRFEKEGYEPVEIMLKRKTSGWIWGNILLGGVFGLVIDFINGAAYELSPTEVKAVLKELEKQGMNIEDLSNKNVVVAVDLQTIKKIKKK